MRKHIIHVATSTVAGLLCVAGHAAQADECDDMAAKIAQQAGLHRGDRTKADFYPLSAIRDDDYGVYLNCGGTYGLNLRFMSPPDPQQDWFQFVGRTGTVLTKLAPSILLDGTNRCLDAASQSGRHYASYGLTGARFICDIDENSKRVELTIAR